jgi:hypothetical protein
MVKKQQLEQVPAQQDTNTGISEKLSLFVPIQTAHLSGIQSEGQARLAAVIGALGGKDKLKPLDGTKQADGTVVYTAAESLHNAGAAGVVTSGLLWATSIEYGRSCQAAWEKSIRDCEKLTDKRSTIAKSLLPKANAMVRALNEHRPDTEEALPCFHLSQVESMVRARKWSMPRSKSSSDRFELDIELHAKELSHVNAMFQAIGKDGLDVADYDALKTLGKVFMSRLSDLLKKAKAAAKETETEESTE